MELTWLFDPSPLAVSGQAHRHTKPELWQGEREGKNKNHCIHTAMHIAAKSKISKQYYTGCILHSTDIGQNCVKVQ